MKKIYLTANGKEVKIGEAVTTVDVLTHPVFGEVCSELSILVTPESIPMLKKAGIIAEEGDPGVKILSGDMIVERLAKKQGWKPQKMMNYLVNLADINPAAWFNTVLREVAVILDEEYEDHIENSPEIYVISMFDGRITKANKAHIKNYRNFAAFRSVEDARIACRFLKGSLKELFSGK